ncbi:hypothetical protein [Candidatus Lucifugimonas marina]|jgi:hypothetical protein|uniref:Gluconate 2-dehydrogenase subunit 3 family protein n=1 Tax=Candidatus Lucifugimonas marina TaxID=3038979 RepID=A0AAJ6CRP9_9CHLR|nr:hypothetical protein [SAR202 cluster bacterium JH702]MDG0868880.1 hypothetical protein [SAR202 cluster bacterium JH639]WFG35509.1 hypothetical protein GKN94_07320 [SAR202 cluster bacterium JH545]WFG39456.1 hypothetical protein GKO48_07435 [SAR202 cluster bacterium JH1073]
MSANTTNTNIDQNVLAALLDRLIPAIDDLPSAGQMGLAEEIIRLSGQQDRFSKIFTNAMGSFASINPNFITSDGTEQDAAIRAFESNSPELFDSILTISYIVYYKDERVHKRIGWSGNTPQPDGNEMEPWDESILENMRKREPFWRQV